MDILLDILINVIIVFTLFTFLLHVFVWWWLKKTRNHQINVVANFLAKSRPVYIEFDDATSVYFLYHSMDHQFICQSNSIQGLAEACQQAKVPLAIVKWENSYMFFHEGKVIKEEIQIAV